MEDVISPKSKQNNPGSSTEKSIVGTPHRELLCQIEAVPWDCHRFDKGVFAFLVVVHWVATVIPLN